MGLVRIKGAGIRNAQTVKPVRTEKTAAVVAVLQRERRARRFVFVYRKGRW